MSRGRTAHLKSFPAVWYLFYAFLAGVLFAHGLRQTGRCQRSPLRDSRRSKKGAQRRREDRTLEGNVYGAHRRELSSGHEL